MANQKSPGLPVVLTDRGQVLWKSWNGICKKKKKRWNSGEEGKGSPKSMQMKPRFQFAVPTKHNLTTQVEVQETQTQILGFISRSHQDTDSQRSVESHKGAVRQCFISDISAFAKRFPLNPRTRWEEVFLWPACLLTTVPNPMALDAIGAHPGTVLPCMTSKRTFPCGQPAGGELSAGVSSQGRTQACMSIWVIASPTSPQLLHVSTVKPELNVPAFPPLPFLLLLGQWQSTLTCHCLNQCPWLTKPTPGKPNVS